MNFKETEQKWQKKWLEWGINSFDKSKVDNKYYVLEMFTYPSAANLHIGHCYNFAPADAYARFKKMQGYNVFQPMGFDAFGLPAENYAIKTGIHPKKCTLENISIMEKQLDSIAPMYDWDSKLITCLPDYYRWTQYLFLQLYKAGLAYQKHAPVNWCTSCNTAIANEQVVDSRCERCGADVVKKNLNQWFFKITDYAEKLLSGLNDIDWPEKTKAMQRNWIGKSSGGEISFPLKNDSSKRITVFTTRPDTLMGVSYVVLAPDHNLVNQITTAVQLDAVKEYQHNTSKLTDIERLSDKSEKTGVFTGAYCIHPITNQNIPVYIADYCLSTYGTGAVMGVPAHDERDYDFAKKYGLEIKRVIEGDGINDALPYTLKGKLVNSGAFESLDSEDAKERILEYLSQKGLGQQKINYRLRDWSVSRQRYWGCPIPIIHCEKCGAVPVPEKDLPVELPMDVDFTPDGKSPLSSHKGFMEVDCPVCGKKALREADTLDTFVCSSWYFLRYPDNKNSDKPFDSGIINKMLPVDVYVGGAEHACMHLLYSRFFVKAMRDIGLLNFDEPFKRLIHQGMILGSDGEKMSKSKGNVINPDKYIAEFGTDALRLYLMFGFSYIDGGPWSEDGMKAIPKFMDRLERIILSCLESDCRESKSNPKDDADLEYSLNYCIKNVRADLEAFSFNTAIARIMELTNALYKYSLNAEINKRLFFETGKILIRLIAPFVPYFAEELNQKSGENKSVFLMPYPDFNPDKLVKNEIEIAVQINSKIVGRINIATDLSEQQIIDLVRNQIPGIEGKTIKKTILIKDRLINLII